MGAAKRKEYDQELFPEGVPAPPPLAGPAAAGVPRPAPPPASDEAAPAIARPPMPTLTPRTEYTGPLLRQIREALGIELREITERSKIGMSYLIALEGEITAKLPASVYIRGFLGEYARILGLDSKRVIETYLERYKAVRGGIVNEEHADDDPGQVKRR